MSLRPRHSHKRFNCCTGKSCFQLVFRVEETSFGAALNITNKNLSLKTGTGGELHKGYSFTLCGYVTIVCICVCMFWCMRACVHVCVCVIVYV